MSRKQRREKQQQEGKRSREKEVSDSEVVKAAIQKAQALADDMQQRFYDLLGCMADHSGPRVDISKMRIDFDAKKLIFSMAIDASGGDVEVLRQEVGDILFALVGMINRIYGAFYQDYGKIGHIEQKVVALRQDIVIAAKADSIPIMCKNISRGKAPIKLFDRPKKDDDGNSKDRRPVTGSAP